MCELSDGPRLILRFGVCFGAILCEYHPMQQNSRGARLTSSLVVSLGALTALAAPNLIASVASASDRAEVVSAQAVSKQGLSKQGAVESPVFHDGISVVRATIRSPRDVRVLLALTTDMLSHRLDYGTADFLFDAPGLRALVASGVPHEILVADLGPLLRADFAARAAKNNAKHDQGQDGAQGGVAGVDFFADFRTLDEINTQLDAFVAAHPDMVTAFTVGTSLEGRAIRGVRITKAPAGSPGVLFNSLQHAREWAGPMTTMYIADRLIAGYGSDARVTALLNSAWIDVIPVVNPDGYVYSWSTNRLWRKNRRDNGGGAFGVDLNRNWAYQWGGGGASTDPTNETYRGVAAFSEPESAAMGAYFAAQPLLAGHIDFHSYSQLILSPWGYTVEQPPNAGAFLALGNEMKSAITRTTGASYVAGPIGSTLYIASGSAVDHAFGAHGVASWTIEVRDQGSYGFVMPVSEIMANVTENYAAAMELADGTVSGAVIRLADGAPTTINLSAPQPLIAEVRAIRGTLSNNGVHLRARVGSSGAFSDTTATDGGNGLFSAGFPTAPCGARIEWYLEAATSVGAGRLPHATGEVFVTMVTQSSDSLVDTMETNLGWTVGATGDTATLGVWTRVDPVGTTAQPESDSLDLGAMCFITGQGVIGGAAGAADVDGGATTLTSPLIDATNDETLISYHRWYSNSLGGAPNSDSMPISISNDNGATWMLLEDVTENAGAWVAKSFRVADFVTPSAAVRVRFQARDLGTGSLVEAGVDFVRVSISGCADVPADLNGDGIVDGADISMLLNNWGGAGIGDIDGNGIVDAADLSALLNAWG